MAQTQLRELINEVEITGTLKKKELEAKTSKSGKDMIQGKLTIEVKDGDRVNNIRVEVLVMKLKKDGNISKMYTSMETVMAEYKAKTDFPDEADRVRITGSLGINEYYGQEGNLISFNQVRGKFYNRLEAGDQTPDKALATIDLVVENFVDKVDSEGLVTGELNVEAFTVGYGSQVIPIKNLILSEDLAADFSGLYAPGSTGKLTFKINNYATVVASETQVVPQHGFGSAASVESNVVSEYTNNFEIIGGDLPYAGSKEYNEDEISTAQKVRALALQEMQQNSSANDTPQQNTKPSGFGSAKGTPPAAKTKETPKTIEGEPEVKEDPFGDDMPDF